MDEAVKVVKTKGGEGLAVEEGNICESIPAMNLSSCSAVANTIL